MIYFDNAATTKPCREAVCASIFALENGWGNPSSAYSFGTEAEHLLSDARAVIEKSFGLGAKDGRIIFTGCGSESNNTAIFGTVYAKKRKGNEKIITSDSEHPSVENAVARLEENGFNVVRVPTSGGMLDLEFLSENAEGAILASFMLANNETGAVYDVRKAADIVRMKSPKAIIHSDCVQAYMKADISPKKLGVDLISVSGHKVFAPKGVGCLWVKESLVKSKSIVPYIVGGGQEKGYRSGTENTPAICALAAAVRLGMSEKESRTEKVRVLYDLLCNGISDRLPEIKLNIPENHLPYVLSMTLPSIKSETFLNYLSSKGIFVSAGSACSAHSGKPSRVLMNYGLSEREADTTIRISICHDNTAAEVELFIAECEKGIASLQRMR